MYTLLDAEVPNSNHNTNTYGDGACLYMVTNTHTPSPWGRVQVLPNLGVPFYLCIQPYSQNYKI